MSLAVKKQSEIYGLKSLCGVTSEEAGSQ
jgi:hypothetical protein